MSTLKVNKIRDTAGAADSITLDPNGGAVIAGVTTVSTVKVGSGVTITSDGDIFHTGVCTATSFAGEIPAASIVGVCTSGLTKTGGFGVILQVVQTMKTDTFSSTTSSSWTDITGVSVNITPSSTSSKVLVSFHGACGSSDDSYSWLRMARVVGGTTTIDLCRGDSRGSSVLCTLDGVQGVNDGFETATSRHSSFEFLDSPNTTSEVTYKMQFYKAMGTNFIIGGTYQTQDANKGSMPTFMTAKEVGA